MPREIRVTKEQYAEIARWEDEGGAPVDVIYIILDDDEPQDPAAVEVKVTNAA